MLTFDSDSANCLSHHITINNDDTNEAENQFFIIQLSLNRSLEPNLVTLHRQISLGVIVDDDRKFLEIIL